MGRKSGFSLVELLTVAGILTLLLALSFPAIQSIRESSRQTHCRSQMQQMSLALVQFELVNGTLPAAISVDRPHFSLHWQARILPYLEEGDLFNEVKTELDFRVSIRLHRHQFTTVSKLQCVSDPDLGLIIPFEFGNSFAFTDYCGVGGIAIDHELEGIFPNGLARLVSGIKFAEITDGLSNTLAFGERPPNGAGRGYGQWLGSHHTGAATIGVYENPANFNYDGTFANCLGGSIGFRKGERGNPCSALHHWSYHPGGANFALADGSVRFIPYAISATTLEALATRAGGETGALEF